MRAAQAYPPGMNDEPLWEREIYGVKYRILRIDDEDCLVERKDPDGAWRATDDEEASYVYMTAFLDLRKSVTRAPDGEERVPCGAV